MLMRLKLALPALALAAAGCREGTDIEISPQLLNELIEKQGQLHTVMSINTVLAAAALILGCSLAIALLGRGRNGR